MAKATSPTTAAARARAQSARYHARGGGQSFRSASARALKHASSDAEVRLLHIKTSDNFHI
eukprot:8527823-Pyramimonas_sp.AAC.1